MKCVWMQASPKLRATWIWGFVSNTFIMKPEFLPLIVGVVVMVIVIVIVVNSEQQQQL